MTAKLELSVIVSTFERPAHLHRCLLSLAMQQFVDGQFEVIVVDDGSRDNTPRMVRQFAEAAPFPVTFLTHPHDGFQLARCRNSGIRLASAPYLLLTDGDCIFPPDHLYQHLQAREEGVVRAGECLRLSEALSRRIDEESICSTEWLNRIPPRSLLERWSASCKARYYRCVRHTTKPKLVGNNIGVWLNQLQGINGFDQQYRGWGCEDDDLRARLVQSGQQIRTLPLQTVGYHLWHAPDRTTPVTWREGDNIEYFQRNLRLTHCLHGLQARPLELLTVHVRGSREFALWARPLQRYFRGTDVRADIEVVFASRSSHFRSSADCRLLVSVEGQRVPKPLARQATTRLSLPPDAPPEQLLNTLVRQLRRDHSPAAISREMLPTEAYDV